MVSFHKGAREIAKSGEDGEEWLMGSPAFAAFSPVSGNSIMPFTACNDCPV